MKIFSNQGTPDTPRIRLKRNQEQLAALYQHAFQSNEQVGCFPHPILPSTRWKRHELWRLCCSSSSGCRSECQRSSIQHHVLAWFIIGGSPEWSAVHAWKEMSS